MATKHDSAHGAKGLSEQQLAAVELLVAGQSVVAVAEQVGCARQTVSGWCNRHSGFRAALNRRRLALWAGHADRLRALADKALNVLSEGLEDRTDPRLRQAAAVVVLRGVGLWGLGMPMGPTRERDAMLLGDED